MPGYERKDAHDRAGTVFRSALAGGDSSVLVAPIDTDPDGATNLALRGTTLNLSVRFSDDPLDTADLLVVLWSRIRGAWTLLGTQSLLFTAGTATDVNGDHPAEDLGIVDTAGATHAEVRSIAAPSAGDVDVHAWTTGS